MPLFFARFVAANSIAPGRRIAAHAECVHGGAVSDMTNNRRGCNSWPVAAQDSLPVASASSVTLRGKRWRGAAFVSGVLATCVLVATGCGSPTAPDGSDGVISVTVTDRLRRPIAGALVAVMDGALSRTTKLTDAAGRVEFSTNIESSLTLRASRDGFHTKTEMVSGSHSSDGVTRFHLWLESVEPTLGLEPGSYTLTISIDLKTATTWMPQAPCAGFPVELASRTYRATVTEATSSLPNYNRLVSADDPTLTWPLLFAFGVAGRFVGFEWDDPLTEALPEFRNLRIGGAAPTTEPAVADGASVSIPFHGSFEYCQTRSGHNNSCWHEPPEKIVAFHSCSSERATMVFSKR